ncbi:hypothetical protein HPULCUR_004721 [Helicostylum pulchrum]|uniref:LOV domain-containing protein n=1 Tax=Helicostylum pulchrum TaxID=562976 RepID=A0ABP9XYA8_9FUNG
MNSSELKKPDEGQLSLNDSLTEDYIVQQRACDDSTPKSNQSFESDADSNNELASQGFDRFRENSISFDLVDTILSPLSANNPRPTDSIAEYCAESLYSYSFTPLSRVNKAAKIKRQILTRGMDYMQRIRWKTRERDVCRRFSQPDFGVLDDWSEGQEPIKPCPSVTDMTAIAHHFLPCSPKPKLPTPSPKQNTTTSTPLIPPHVMDEIDAEGFNLGRRQTIEVLPNLPPIYEVPKPTRIPISPQYTRALHAPSRFLPQNQAILTTDVSGTILLFNDMASLCFGIDKSYIGKSILPAIEDPFQKQISSVLNRRKNLASVKSQLPTGTVKEKGLGLVLVCGVVVSIKKMNDGEASSAASLWLKEKTTDEGNNVYIWIFEEIYETSLTTHLDSKGNITKVVGTTKELFGYDPDQVIGNPITKLIPALSNDDSSVNIQKIEKLKFYGGRSKTETCFPVMVNRTSATNILKIVSLPSIAGLITVHNNGRIQSINPVPAKYLFGYAPETLVEKVNIDEIIPQFSNVLDGLRRCSLLQYACTVNNHACRWAISELCSADAYKSMEVGQSLKSLERSPSVTSTGQTLPIIMAVHRDGSQFEIQLQLRLIESDKEDLISVWVTYDRIHALKRIKKLAVQNKKTPVLPSLSPIPAVITPDDEFTHPLSPAAKTIPIQKEEPTPPKPIKKRPPIRPYGISSFGSVDKRKALFPTPLTETKSSSPSSSSEHVPTLSTQKEPEPAKPHPMDNYCIIGTLGEGAYGTAKLAYLKDDVTETKVVIKFIAKSRIVLDSWIRDRQLGSIPLEIHILRKLQQFRHENCCCLETFFEDDDTYFVVMKLHGTSSMDLFDYIELNENISESEIQRIFKQVASAVKHIHDLGIVHRDIKDENILLDELGSVSLIDFGSAAYFRKGRTFDTFGGTLDYCAPEILKGMAYEGPPQDIWSLGTLLYTLVYRENPFYNVDEIMEHDLRIPFVLSEGSLDLIQKMLNRDVDKRYSIHQVLEHPWLNQSQPITDH